MTKRTVFLKKYLDIKIEKEAVGAITPGMLIELDSSDKVKAHATPGGNAFPMFAVEDEFQGKLITDDYAIEDVVQCWIPTRGDEVYAVLVKGGTAATIGSLLESAGDGSLQVHAADDSTSANTTNQIVAQAIEAVDLSDSSGADPATYRIKVRIL